MEVKALNTRIVALALMLGAGPAAAVSFGMNGGANTPLAAGSPRSLAVADVNGDGRLDSAVHSPLAKTLAVSYNDGAGNMAEGFTWNLAEREALSVAAGDLNGDGFGDLAISYRDGISVYPNSGGAFTQAISLSAARAGQIAFGDVNGDRVPDIINLTGNLYGPSKVSVFFGLGKNSFSEEFNVLEAENPGESMTVGDLNGDGALDLMFYSGFGTITVALGDGTGKFAVQPSASLGGLEGATPISIAVGDYTGDRVNDIVVQSEGRGLSILAGDGAGGYVQHSDVPYATEKDGFVNPIEMGDVNLDGLVDVIQVDSATGKIVIFQ